MRLFDYYVILYDCSCLCKKVQSQPKTKVGGSLRKNLDYVRAGLCSRGARLPQVKNFCLWATGKTFFFHIHVSLSAGHPRFHG